MNRFVKGAPGSGPEEAARRGCPEAHGAGRRQRFPCHPPPPRANHYPRKTWDPLWGWAPRFAELTPCPLRPTVTQFPHPLKDWDDDGNPKMKEDAQRQGPFSLPKQRGQTGRKSQTRSRTPIPPPPRPPGSRYPLPSRALLPPPDLPVQCQASPWVWLVWSTLPFNTCLCAARVACGNMALFKSSLLQGRSPEFGSQRLRLNYLLCHSLCDNEYIS